MDSTFFERTSEELVGGGFAFMDAPFGSHQRDRERAAIYLFALVREQKTWSEAESQIRTYLGGQGLSAANITKQVDIARKRIEPWLG